MKFMRILILQERGYFKYIQNLSTVIKEHDESIAKSFRSE